MSVESFITDAGTQVAVEADQTATGSLQTSMGGVDRSSSSWVVIADAVPCLIETTITERLVVNNQLQYQTKAVIYLMTDPVPGGLSITHRMRVTINGKPGPAVSGIWSILGVNNPIPFGHHLEIDALRIGLPS